MIDKEKINELETPCYIIEEDKLKNNFYGLKDAFSELWNNEIIIGYSFKTNSLPWVLGWMKRNGAYAEIVSSDELELAKKIGFPLSNIVFNGPVKGDNGIIEVLNAGGIVNLDSFSEIELLKNNKPDNDKVWKVGLRINFDLEKYCPGETIPASEYGRFGFNIENGSFKEAVDELNKINYVKITGLHGHHSTKTKSLNIFTNICKKLVEVAELLPNNCEYVDIGGCLFGDKPGAPTFNEYAEIITTELYKSSKFKESKLIIEPGASVIASPLYYLCKVVDSKKVIDKTFVTTNGTLLHINPQMHSINFMKEIIKNGECCNSELLPIQELAGYTCIEKDRLGKLENIEKLNKNDIILIYNTGAYTMALTPLFIQYFPCVYVYENGNYRKIREKWTAEEYILKNEVF